jgi:hypothetical protein
LKLKGYRDGERRGWHFWCLGCDGPHGFNDTWQKSGPDDAPTVSPSLLTRDHAGGVCHLFIRNGQLEFLDDCTHPLAGKTVAIPEWPYS